MAIVQEKTYLYNMQPVIALNCIDSRDIRFRPRLVNFTSMHSILFVRCEFLIDGKPLEGVTMGAYGGAEPIFLQPGFSLDGNIGLTSLLVSVKEAEMTRNRSEVVIKFSFGYTSLALFNETKKRPTIDIHQAWKWQWFPDNLGAWVPETDGSWIPGIGGAVAPSA